MTENTVCTFSEAAAAWEMCRGEGENYHGLILTVDLDRVGAGLCLCRSEQPPQLLWESSAADVLWYTQADREFLKDCTEDTAVEALVREGNNSDWNRIQKNYLRLAKRTDFPLPPLVVDGREYTLTCAELDGLLLRYWDESMSRVLSQAKEQMERLDKELPRRILPVGALARLFLAEYRIRAAFLEMPLLPDPLIRTWGDKEDPAQIVEKGKQLYHDLTAKLKTLPFTLRLQVQRLVEGELKPELLTLAEKDTPYDQLQEVAYVGPIVIGPEDDLVLFADSQMQRIAPGFLRFKPEQRVYCVEAGVGMYREKLSLHLRDGDSTAVWINLDFD